MPKAIIHDHDGHVDDLLSCILLWLSPDVELQAIGITNGDCHADQAFEAMLKMATFLDLEGPEIGVMEDELPNPFPDNWRRESYIINELPIFGENDLKKPYQQGKGRRSDTVFVDCLSHSRRPLTVVTTGPLTTVASLLRKQPALKKNIAEMVIMGGAVSAPGNVEENGHDGTAEWNVYADAGAFKAILDTGIPIKLITLDVTNELPVTKEFLQRLEEQSATSKASLLAAKLWSLVKGFNYYFWDTVTAAAAIKPELFTFKEMKIDVTTSGKSAGRTATSMFGGRKVQVATQVQKSGFEELLLSILRTR
ncbi:MAG TPA: nucleoside hydrolase [Planktothrix sp.]|jgi:purine nucleosidase